MRLLIASDLHGSLQSLHFLEDRIRELAPDMVVLLGDLVYHGPRNPLPPGYDTPGLLHDMPGLTAMRPPVTAVRGNCDAEVDVCLMPFPMPESAWLDVDGLRIFACHGHRLPEAPPVPSLPAGTVILRGHTHVPRGETLDGLHFWNPGSLSLPKQGFPRSYGLYEDGVFRVLAMDGGEILRHAPAASCPAPGC
ncbi:MULTISPECIES: phosphodiesterase [unclassified Desulfovibrio]|uniref:phosphodiesterase n=1 Tax=unclassified Desulfovibrio TaxID=2593640 RepID=UPI0013EDB6D3|nr:MULTISPECIES: phosphodiesterase [unclassified Desulfovibrio]